MNANCVIGLLRGGALVGRLVLVVLGLVVGWAKRVVGAWAESGRAAHGEAKALGGHAARRGDGGGRAAGVRAALAALVVGLAGGGAAARLRRAPATRFGPPTRFRALTPFSAPVAALVLALAAFASAPAAAQTAVTVTLSASGNCGGTPANCGANGDRDAAWPGLQVDEGDIVTFGMGPNPPLPTGSYVVANGNVSGTGYTLADLRRTGGLPLTVLPSTISFTVISGQTRATLAYLVAADGATESDETLTVSLTSTNVGGSD